MACLCTTAVSYSSTLIAVGGIDVARSVTLVAAGVRISAAPGKDGKGRLI